MPEQPPGHLHLELAFSFALDGGIGEATTVPLHGTLEDEGGVVEVG